MKKIDVMYVKKYYEKLCGLCDILDEKKLWDSPEFEGVHLRDIFRHNIGEYLLYLSASDNTITDEESYLYNAITGFNGNKEKMVQYINDNDIYSSRFESEVPLIIRLVKECEKNAIGAKNIIQINCNKSCCDLFTDFFTLISNVMIEIDNEVACPELEDSNIYLNTINKFVCTNDNSMADYYSMIDLLEVR